MEIIISNNSSSFCQEIATKIAHILNDRINSYGVATLVLSTGSSQLEEIKLLFEHTVAWNCVNIFLIDDYIGFSEDDPNSCSYDLKILLKNVPSLKKAYLFNTDKDADTEVSRINGVISNLCINVCLIGIGQNGHIAFNFPPTDINTNIPFTKVKPGLIYKKEQVSKGWFKNINEVPDEVITMSIQQIMRSEIVIASVPYENKAQIIKCLVEGGVNENLPASFLKNHPCFLLFLDEQSSSMLNIANINN